MDSKLVLFVAEDSEMDLFLLEREINKFKPAVDLHTARDGVEAIEYLERLASEPDHITADQPRLMLLDLKMPRKDGFDVLQFRLDQANLKCLPVVVFSSSDEPEDVRRAYDLGASAYVCKPTQSSDFSECIAALHTFWGKYNRCPTPARG